MVEFSGDDEREVADRVDKLRRRLRASAGLTAAVAGGMDPAVRDPLWDLRKASMPLLYGMPRRPQAGHVRGGLRPCRAGAAAGVHRPLPRGAAAARHRRGLLRPRQRRLPAHPPAAGPEGPRRRGPDARITEDVTDLVLEYNGSLAGGEHGDGLARSRSRNEKTVRGRWSSAPGRSRQVKAAVHDPDNLLSNPGKIVDAPRMTENLRYGPDLPAGRGCHRLFNLRQSRRASSAPSRCATATAPVARRRAARCARPSFRATARPSRTTAPAGGPTCPACGWRLSGRTAVARVEKYNGSSEVFDLCA